MVIVHCQNFTHTNLSYRQGSECDRDGLKILFDSLGFTVVIWEDKTAQVFTFDHIDLEFQSKMHKSVLRKLHLLCSDLELWNSHLYTGALNQSLLLLHAPV